MIIPKPGRGQAPFYRPVAAAALALVSLAPVAASEAASLHQQGLAAMAAGDWAKAVDVLEEATAAAPNDIVVGTDYRQAVIGAATAEGGVVPYDRCIAFFEKLVADHPDAPNAFLNLGFANVDKIPAEGAITQVILADRALGYFGSALELEESWLGYYSRGHAYLFWPAIFSRYEDGIADLEKANGISDAARKAGEDRPYYARAWAALGDGYWRGDDLARSRQIWKQGLELYPDDPELRARDALADAAELEAFLEEHYDTTQRVGTHLNEIFGERSATGASQ